ncbi:MAG: MFS transporter [Pseudomonadota bacterium]
MIDTLVGFYAKSADAPPRDPDNEDVQQELRRRKWQVFFAITFGYGFYYVCRLSINVAKPLMDEAGVFDAAELGLIGSALYFSYAFGKLTNGVLADHVNQRRFMATGMFVSALANLFLGFTTIFWVFILLWGINGWFQSFGAASSVRSISNWYAGEERGSIYGMWASSHNIGEAVTFVGTAIVVSYFGWMWGFRASGIVCLLASFYMLMHVHERPAAYGLPSPRTQQGETGFKALRQMQLEVIKTPAVWIVALASASFYITRYAVNSWGIYFLQDARGYSTIEASSIVSVNAIAGIFGTFFSGILSDRLFQRRRNIPSLVFGVVYAFATWLFFFGPANKWAEITAMVLFGLALGALMVYLGGLIAVDICRKEVSGAALGVVGVASYIGAGVQDIISGRMIEDSKSIVNGVEVANFEAVGMFWLGSAIASIILALFVWNAKSPDD